MARWVDPSPCAAELEPERGAPIFFLQSFLTFLPVTPLPQLALFERNTASRCRVVRILPIFGAM